MRKEDFEHASFCNMFILERRKLNNINQNQFELIINGGKLRIFNELRFLQGVPLKVVF